MGKTTWIAAVGVIVVGVGVYFVFQFAGTAGVVSATNVAAQTPVDTADYHDNIYLTRNDPVKGGYMTDFAGVTLYTYDTDSPGVSHCTGTCAITWKPYVSGATSQGTMPTNITVITRDDGGKQFAWKGMPLYYYEKDQNPGDITGDGNSGAWHIVHL